MTFLQAFIIWLMILLPIGLAMINVKVSIYSRNPTVRQMIDAAYFLCVIVGLILALPALLVVFALSLFGNAPESRHDD